MTEVKAKPWCANFLRWCKENGYSGIPDKVLNYIDDKLAEPMLSRLKGLKEEVNTLKYQKAELVKCIEMLSLEVAQLKVKKEAEEV